MIAILAISLKYKNVFSIIGYLITLLQNRLKKDVIKAFRCLNTWYKQVPTS